MRSRRSKRQLSYQGYTFKSIFEKDTAKVCQALKIEWEYEPESFPYIVPASKHHYTPDFRILKKDGSYVRIETKGIFKLSDRQKMLTFRENYPIMDVRILFMDANKKLYKGSKTTYGQWATKNAFRWGHKTIPDDWKKDFKHV